MINLVDDLYHGFYYIINSDNINTINSINMHICLSSTGYFYTDYFDQYIRLKPIC